MTRQETIDRLLKSYRVYYNIHENDNGDEQFVARCDYFENAKKYVIMEKAELWHSDSEEFLYLFNVPHLDLATYEKYSNFAYEDGMDRIDVHPGHMYSFITPIFICDTCDEDAAKAIKKCRIYKSFQFSLQGWMDFHVAAVILSNDKKHAIIRNRSGHTVGKILKKVLFSSKK